MSIEQNEEQEISSEEKSYFAMIPHMADDDLPIYQHRLYCHYRRVCGERNGKCTELTRTTAEKIGISPSTVVEARRELAERKPPYIKLHRRRERNVERVDVTLTDIWPANMERYKHGTDRGANGTDRGANGTDRGANGTDRLVVPLKKNQLKEEPIKEEPIKEKLDDAGPSASLPIKEVLTRTHAREAMRSAAIRHLLTAWLPELAGYGGWDNAAEYIDNMPDYRMYGLATWFYKIRSRPAWAAKLDNPAGFIIHQMDTPGAANAGLSPAERITLIGYIDEAESVVRHFQQVEF